MRKTRAIWLCLLPLLLVTAGRADPTLDDEHALLTDFETPHTAWAKPYAKGTTRVLFFSDYRNTQAREIIELMERFDLQADAAYHSRIVDTTTVQWHGGDEGLDRIRGLLENNEYDVYLFNGVPLAHLPTELQYKLLKQVTSGAGLVLVGVDDKRVLKRPIAEHQPGDPDAELFNILAGRGAKLPAAPVYEYTFNWEIPYDYWQERLGRTVLWAAGKAPEHDLQINLAATEVRREDPPPMLGSITGATALPKYRLRREGGHVKELSSAFADGPIGTQVNYAIPAYTLPAGIWHLDAWPQKETLDQWATATFTVTSRRQVAVELQQNWGEVGATIAGQAVLAGEPLAGEQVKVELWDRRGRLLAATEPSAPLADHVPFAFPVAQWYPMLLGVRAVVLDSGGEASDSLAYFNVVKRHRGQFNFLVWDVPGGPTGAYGEEMLARLGMTLQLRGGPPSRVMAAFDTAYVPYTTRIMDDKDAEGHLKPVPWNQSPEIDSYVHGIAEKYLPARQHGVFVYSLGDETVTRGSDNSPSDLAAYRKYLEAQYGTIGKLNASWSTEFQAFDDIALLSADDPRELAAKRDGNYPRWFDRQAWECTNFVQLCKRFGEAYRELDPLALTGFEGAGRFDRGDDFDSIVRTNGFWSPYPGPGDYVIRGIAPREFPRANWMGYRKSADPLIWKYWRMVLNGCDSVWWWRWDGIGRFNGLLMPNLAPFPHIEELLDDTRVTREGLGDLLLHYEHQDDGIAILYSQPSCYAVQVGDGPSYGAYSPSHEAWQDNLQNLGLSFRYVTDAMFDRGEFKADAYKVVILARTEAISDQTAGELKSFVNGGGTVIADLRPGVYDSHCKPRGKGVLDDLFGVDQQGATAALREGGMTLGGPFGELEAAQVTADPGLQPTLAEAQGKAGETPVMLVHKVGLGQAILLNFSLVTYPRVNGPDSPAAAEKVLRAVFSSAGVDAFLRLRRPNGEPVGDLRVERWTDGAAMIVGIQKEPDSVGQLMGMAERTGGTSGKIEISLPGSWQIYDLRQRRSLGRRSRFVADFDPGHARFYALLPRPTEPVQGVFSAGDVPLWAAGGATVPTIRAPRGSTPEVRLSVPGAVTARAMLLTALRPDGTEADWLRQVVVIEPDETVAVPLPLALNDPAGEWMLSVRELFSGARNDAALTVLGE